MRLVDPLPPGWPVWIENWVLPYARDSALRPVLLAILGHVVVVLAPLVLYVVRSGSGRATGILAALTLVSVGLVGFETVRFRRPGAVTVVVLCTWATSLGLAWLADRTGVF